MPEIFFGINDVSHPLTKVFYFRKSSIFLSLEDLSSVNADPESSIYFAGMEEYAMDIFGESRQKLLREISGAQHPSTLRTVLNGNRWLHTIKIGNFDGLRLQLRTSRLPENVKLSYGTKRLPSF